LIWLFGWAPPQRIEKTITQGMDRAQAKRVLDEGRKINTSCARLISGSSHLRDGLFVCFVLAEMYRCFGGDVPMSRLFLPRNNVEGRQAARPGQRHRRPREATAGAARAVPTCHLLLSKGWFCLLALPGAACLSGI
jgi:hypothetical protein